MQSQRSGKIAVEASGLKLEFRQGNARALLERMDDRGKPNVGVRVIDQRQDRVDTRVTMRLERAMNALLLVGQPAPRPDIRPTVGALMVVVSLLLDQGAAIEGQQIVEAEHGEIGLLLPHPATPCLA